MLRKPIKFTVLIITVQLLAAQLVTAANLSLFTHTSISSQNNSLIELDGTMELGHWRDNIANRIYPAYYSGLQLSSADRFAEALSFQGAKMYFNAHRFNEISDLTDGKSYFFTFDYDQSSLQPISFQDSIFHYDQMLLRDNDSFSRSLFAPGIAYRVNEESELSLAVVFAQQNYSDINFLASEINGFDQLDLYAVSHSESNNGLGLNLGVSQKLFNRLTLDTQYQSKIDMDGFSRLMGVQADPADFDIPEHFKLAVGFDLTDRNTITFKATHNYYSDINAFVSRSYPSIFLTFLNDAESPDFNWADQTVYAVNLAHEFKGGAVINLEYSGRQQPPATDADLTTILEAISAPYSVRVGFTKALLGGELDIYASYAPRPLNFGRTDFGNVSSELKGKHTEAVLSWMFTF